LRPNGKVVSSGGLFFEAMPDGTSRLLFAKQSLRVGRHHMCIHGFNVPCFDAGGWSPVSAPSADFLVDVRRNLGEYVVEIAPSDSKFMKACSLISMGGRHPLHFDTLYAFAATISQLAGSSAQYFGVDWTTLERHPDFVSPTGELVDFTDATKGTDILISVPVNSKVLKKVIPSMLSTKYEPDLADSTQFHTIAARLADEFTKDDSFPASQVIPVSLALYATAAIQCERGRSSIQRRIGNVLLTPQED
jgi:hypothetical protein